MLSLITRGRRLEEVTQKGKQKNNKPRESAKELYVGACKQKGRAEKDASSRSGKELDKFGEEANARTVGKECALGLGRERAKKWKLENLGEVRAVREQPMMKLSN